MANPKSMVKTVRAVVYGAQGAGKSWFAATFAAACNHGITNGPLLVSLFDPRGKDSSYFDPIIYGASHKSMELVSGELDLGLTTHGVKLAIPYTEVMIGGKLVCRVEYMHEEELVFGDSDVGAKLDQVITGWTVLPKFRKRLNRLFRDERDSWGTYCFDSATSAELMFRMYHKYVQNPGATGIGRQQWWSGSTDELEMNLAIRLASWPHNVIVICHTDKDKVAGESGSVVSRYTPRLPGRLAGDISTYYAELYHACADTDADGETSYYLQTRPNALFSAFSNSLHAPNPCENDYAALWGGE